LGVTLPFLFCGGFRSVGLGLLLFLILAAPFMGVGDLERLMGGGPVEDDRDPFAFLIPTTFCFSFSFSFSKSRCARVFFLFKFPRKAAAAPTTSTCFDAKSRIASGLVRDRFLEVSLGSGVPDFLGLFMEREP
jgi:hypothetical protein